MNNKYEINIDKVDLQSYNYQVNIKDRFEFCID
jgi:hypothetical protein